MEVNETQIQNIKVLNHIDLGTAEAGTGAQPCPEGLLGQYQRCQSQDEGQAGSVVVGRTPLA